MNKNDLNRLPLNRGPNSHKKGLATGQMTQNDPEAVTKKDPSPPPGPKGSQPVAK